MPFDAGAFEFIVSFVVLAGLVLLMANKGSKSTAPRAQPSGADRATASAPESLDNLIAQGWRVESESTAYLFLVKEQRVNHILHFLVGLLTLGLWWIAWLIIAATGGEERRSIRNS